MIVKEEQIQEAIKRLQFLQLHPNVIRDFRRGIINRSDPSPFGGILFWLTDKEKEYVREFEQKYNAVVYHVIYSRTSFGALLSFLYVSDSEREWKDDQEKLMQGYPFVYVKNLSDDWSSEFGSIGIQSIGGGLLRTA